MLVELEHHAQFCCVVEEFVIVSGQQQDRGVSVSAENPISAQRNQQPIAIDRRARIGGLVDAKQLRAAKFVELLIP